MPAVDAMSDKHDLLAPEGTNDQPGCGGLRSVSSPTQLPKSTSSCLSLAPGVKVICTAAFDQEQRVGQIVEVRKGLSKAREAFVHFDECDKRCDEWVPEGRLYPFNEDLAANLARKRPAEEEAPREDATGRLRRASSRKHDSAKLESASADGKDDVEHENHVLQARHTETIDFGDHEICTWYQSPLPEPYCFARHLYFCPYTMKYFRKRRRYQQHLDNLQVDARHPPGNRIYESPEPSAEHPISTPLNPTLTAATDPKVSMYQVDGSNHRLYCQNLCLLSKMFLDGKSLVWDVQEFDFFVLCEQHVDGEAMVGYYSREKRSEENCLACILTMPHRQKLGYGGLLIDFSYEMARRSGRPGVPERPLSDLGKKAFFQYWERVLTHKLVASSARGPIDLNALAMDTGIHKKDIIQALGPYSRLHELRLVHWLKHETLMCRDYIGDVRSPEVVHELYSLLTEGRHILVVDPTAVTNIESVPQRAGGVGRSKVSKTAK